MTSTIIESALNAIASAKSIDELEKVRVHYLGKQGVLIEQLNTLDILPLAERVVLGTEINASRVRVQKAIATRKGMLV
jgi:phenylalanyl-tRNA synthetase alpha chain